MRSLTLLNVFSFAICLVPPPLSIPHHLSQLIASTLSPLLLRFSLFPFFSFRHLNTVPSKLLLSSHMRLSHGREEFESDRTGKRGFGLGWVDKELRSKNHYIVCLFYGPSFIIALRRQINDNPEFSFVVGYLLRLVLFVFVWRPVVLCRLVDWIHKNH
jgi:hypothetical protein